MITRGQLAVSLQCPVERADKFIDAVNDTLDKYAINTSLRVAHFIAQIGHESGRLRYVREIWGPTAAQKGYEGRKDLGNVTAGDGQRYMGRGLIQITGRANYKTLSDDLDHDFIKHPDDLETPEFAALSAGWFWSQHGLNELADQDLLTRITKIINGGQNGIDDRRAILAMAKKVLGI